MKEMTARMQKLNKRQIDALKAGHLQDDEVDEALHTAAIRNIEKDRVARRDGVADKRRKLQLVNKTQIDIKGKTVYMQQSHRDAPEGMVKVGHPLANFIMCASPGEPPPILKFAACLYGSSICTKEFLLGNNGVCATFVPAVAVKRHIHITEAFMLEQHALAELLLAVTLSGQWDLATTATAHAIVRGQSARQRLVFVFMGSDEADSPDLHGLDDKFMAVTCFDCLMFCKLDKSKCWVGACQL